MLRSVCLILLPACALPPAVLAQAEDSTAVPSIAEQMDQLFFEWDRLDRPGGSVVIVQSGEVLFQRSYGLASLEHGTPNTDRTLYDVAALAEPMTATAIAHLVADGRLSLEDAIHEHLPELRAYQPPVLVRHLVQHTSGLWDWGNVWELAGGRLDETISIGQILDLLARQPAPAFTPGSRSQHSTTNYTLLAEIVARVSGDSYRDWLWAEVLRPAGMLHSLVRDRSWESVEGSAEAYIYQTYLGYTRGSLGLAAPGAHGFYASISDMATWLKRLTAPEGPSNLIPEGTLNDGTPTGYVHGMLHETVNGLTLYRVAKKWQGWNTAGHYFPEQQLGVVVLSNWISDWVDPDWQAGEVARVYLADEIAAATAADASETPTGEATDFTPDPSRYEQLTGDYRWERRGVFAVIVQQEKLAYKDGRQVLPMSELEPDHFVLDDYPFHFRFERDAEGRAVSCLIQYPEGKELNAPRIELAEPSADELVEYAGEYRSSELDVSYSVHIQDEALVLTNRRMGDMRLVPEATDFFSVFRAPFALLEFVRDAQGEVIGLRMDTMDLLLTRED
jgi:CubicO group peptidase (beta-lactamase class C family)